MRVCVCMGGVFSYKNFYKNFVVRRVGSLGGGGSGEGSGVDTDGSVRVCFRVDNILIH